MRESQQDVGGSGAGNEIQGHGLQARHRLVVPAQNFEGWNQAVLQWKCRELRYKPLQAWPHRGDAFDSPIPRLDVAMVLHEEEMSYHSVITTAIQGEEDFHPECPSSVALMLGTEVESELSGAAIDE